MKAILETTGPVATRGAVKAVKMSMNVVTAQLFLEAAKELEKNNFGKLFKISKIDVFIKKPPSEVKDMLRTNPEWCRYDIYAAQYAKGSSKAIGLQLRAKLVSMKLVSKNCFL